MFEITDDYLAAAPLLQAALEQVPHVHDVIYLNDLAELDNIKRTPCLFLLYQGDNVPDNANAGLYSAFSQTWLVVLVDRLGRKSNAGAHLTNTIRALAGKRTGSVGPWIRVNTSLKPKYTKGFGYYPLAFKAQMKLNQQRNQ